MSVFLLILRPVVVFTLVASFSLFFMSLFIIAGLLMTRIQRNVVERQDEVRNLKGYITASIGGLISGCIALVAMTSI